MSLIKQNAQPKLVIPQKGAPANRLVSTRSGGKMVKDYWDRLFSARERGATVVWYNGAALNPIFQAAGIEWCHGERSEEHTSELQSLMRTSYAVFCLQKKTNKQSVHLQYTTILHKRTRD